MRYLVTGGAGFIGSHLVDRLLADGHEVCVVDDFSSGNRDNLPRKHDRLEVCSMDVRSERLEVYVARADAVFHLAAVVGVDQVLAEPKRTIDVTVVGGGNVIAACVAHRKPLLITSTSEVYGDSDQQPLREDMDLRIGPPSSPRWCYATAKLLEEQTAMAAHRDSGLQVVVARLFNTVGPRQTGRYGMVLPRFVEAALAGDPLQIHGDGQQTRSFADVRWISNVLVRLLHVKAAYGMVVNVGSSEETAIYDLAVQVRRALDSDSEVEFVPLAKARGEGFREIQRRLPDTSLLTKIIGWWSTIDLLDTIKLVAEHQAAQMKAGAICQ